MQFKLNVQLLVQNPFKTRVIQGASFKGRIDLDNGFIQTIQYFYKALQNSRQ